MGMSIGVQSFFRDPRFGQDISRKFGQNSVIYEEIYRFDVNVCPNDLICCPNLFAQILYAEKHNFFGRASRAVLCFRVILFLGTAGIAYIYSNISCDK